MVEVMLLRSRRELRQILGKHRENYESTQNHATWERAQKVRFLNLQKLDPLHITVSTDLKAVWQKEDWVC